MPRLRLPRFAATAAAPAPWLPMAILAAACASALAHPRATAPVPQRWAPAGVASDQYESSPSFSADGRELYFMRSDRNFAQWRILHSRCTAAGWSPPRPPGFAAARPGLDADPFLAADGKRLYFVSARHDPKGEDLDIYFVERASGGQASGRDWGEPVRLPAPVNSPSAELLPRALPGGRLYFGSARDGGLGQGDLYVATPKAGGGWDVRNLGAPLSSAANEYEAEVSPDGRELVAVADRGDRSHLYRYRLERGRWRELGKVPAREDVFQVGPLLSPRGDRLLFAQADGARSGEFFVIDLAPGADRRWPPDCAAAD